MKSVDTPAGLAELQGSVYVAVDIGGTNARIAVQEAAGTKGLVVVRKLSDMDRLLAFFKEVEDVVARRCNVLGAAVAGPGPRDAAATILGPFSNYTSEEKRLRLSVLPVKLFPQGKTTLLNDLEAAAYGIASLSESGRYHRYFSKMWGPNDEAKMKLQDGPYLILAVGTGCGTGLVFLHGGVAKVLPLEFGHTTIVPEEEDKEWLFELGKERYGVVKLAEYEDVVGGQGLVRCWDRVTRNVKEAPKLTQPVEVARRAKGACPHALAALHLHYKYLFSLASDLSMGFVLGGVVIAGDNILHNDFFITNPTYHHQLKDHFLSHTMDRMGFQSRVTVSRQTASFSLNLEGAFFKAREAGSPASKL